LPPQPSGLPNIGDALSAKGVTWRYYYGGRGNGTRPTADYCGICDPLTGLTSIMDTPLKHNLKVLTHDTTDIQALPVRYVAHARAPLVTTLPRLRSPPSPPRSPHPAPPASPTPPDRHSRTDQRTGYP